MGIFNKKKGGGRRKPTTGFSELNRRTYEASETGRAQRVQQNSSYGYQNPQTQNNRNAFTRANNHDSAENYSRQRHQQRYASTRKQLAKKSRRKKILIVVSCIIAATAIVVGTVFGIISCNMNSGMSDIGLTPTSLDKPFYMILMGVDSSNERKADGGTDDDYRSDSIILARIAANEKKVTLMSMHRDIEVDMGQYGTQKLNAAHSLGGPELVIKTVSKIAGVNINHYAEINFDGFQAAVDDLGGVEVDVPIDIYDPMAGGALAAGKQTLNGEQALILCRARHAFDDFGDGDKYRAANQRMVLSAIAQKALSSDIITIAKTATDLSKYIKTDLALNDMIGLAQLMKDLDPKTDIYTAMTPTEGVYKDGAWYEELDKEKFKKMMERMDKGLPPDEETYIDPATGTVMSTAGAPDGVESNFTGKVSVRNGTNKEGLASKASNKIYQLGFTTDVGNANTQDYKNTIIIYANDEDRAGAEAIKDVLGCGQVLKDNGEYSFTGNILVVVGTDFSS